MNPASSKLMPAYARQPVAFSHGRGAYLWDEHGVEYLDAIAGIAVTNLGHSHPEITEAIAVQAGQLLHSSNMYGIIWQERLGELLCERSGMESVFFCNSGSEANETALKLARLHASNKQVGAPQILVMENSFHGRTMATLAATGNPAVHKGFFPLMPGFIRVPYNDIEAVRAAAAENPDIVAVLVEPVQGEGGVRIASAEYLQALRAIADQYDWLLMIDEVQTGMCRTGKWFGFQHAGIQPDVMTLAKGLGNGFPIGACLAHGKAHGLMLPGHHGSTFGGNPLACRVGCKVVELMEQGNLAAKAAAGGRRMLVALTEALSDLPGVVAVRGHGLLLGIGLDRNCKELVEKAIRDERILISVTRDEVIRLLPALVCSDRELDEITNRVIRVVQAWSAARFATQTRPGAAGS